MSKPASSAIQNKKLIVDIGNRNGFFPAAMEKLTKIAIWNSALSMVLIMSLAAAYIFQPSPQSYAVSPDGRITKLIPLSESAGPAAIADFASRAIISSYSIDFLNWKSQLGSLATYYTEDGFNTYMEAVMPLKDRVVDGRYITSVGFSSPPIIVKQGVVNGAMKYKVRAGVVIGFEGQTKRIATQNWQVDAIIDRVPSSKSQLGLAISSIIAKQSAVN
jgi:intracellular multiplication protein IcmL